LVVVRGSANAREQFVIAPLANDWPTRKQQCEVIPKRDSFALSKLLLLCMADYRDSDWAGYKVIAKQHGFDWKPYVNPELVRLAEEFDDRMKKGEIRGTYKNMAERKFWAPDPAAPTTNPLGYKIIDGTEKVYRNWVERARKWVVQLFITLFTEQKCI
jgi:hypothetical protein